jgi:hypothetical protein
LDELIKGIRVVLDDSLLKPLAVGSSCRVLKGLYLVLGKYETFGFAWVNKQADLHLSQEGLKY